MNDNDLNQKAYYKHNNGDLEPLIVHGYDSKGMAWVTWIKDGFKNMIDEKRLVEHSDILELQLTVHALEKRCDSLQSEIDNMRPKMDVNPNYCKGSENNVHIFDFVYPHNCMACRAPYHGTEK